MPDFPDNWSGGDAYERFMGRWSRQIAKEFIAWLCPPAAWNWLELGCGTGALTEAVFLHAAPAAVVACDPQAMTWTPRHVSGREVAGPGAAWP